MKGNYKPAKSGTFAPAATSRIETGRNIPSGPVIYALSEALSASSDAILALTEPDRGRILRSSGHMPFRVRLDESTISREVEEAAV